MKELEATLNPRSLLLVFRQHPVPLESNLEAEGRRS